MKPFAKIFEFDNVMFLITVTVDIIPQEVGGEQPIAVLATTIKTDQGLIKGYKVVEGKSLEESVAQAFRIVEVFTENDAREASTNMMLHVLARIDEDKTEMIFSNQVGHS